MSAETYAAGNDELKAAISSVSTALQADIILYSGTLGHGGDTRILGLVEACCQRANVVLFLTTIGGSAESAYRTARYLQGFYKEGKFTLFVNWVCKSAGTLLALGAHEIVMSRAAELGPLDVQIEKPDDVAERQSGLVPPQAIKTLGEKSFDLLEDVFLKLRFRSGLQITTKTALEAAVSLASGLFCPIFQQIDPIRIGETIRAMQIAERYGARIATDNVKTNTIARLTQDYPSHDFVIDIEEARTLFESVREPSMEEARLARMVYPLVEQGQKQESPIVEFLSHLTHENGDNDDSSEANQSREIPARVGGDCTRNDAPPEEKARNPGGDVGDESSEISPSAANHRGSAMTPDKRDKTAGAGIEPASGSGAAQT